MSAPRFVDLFRWELGRVGRSILLWSILAVLAASFVWGALSTAALHAAQQRGMEDARAADAELERSTAERARAYAGPVSDTEGPVAYWQDPTDVAGYSQYFVRKWALKPHRPLSPLAAGVSDLAPSRLEIKLNIPFGFVDTYDFENPRGLALGRFDLAFAIVFLLPIGVLLLFSLLLTFERDRGMLPLIAAQAVGPRRWIGARTLAILTWTLPAVMGSVAAALAAAGVPLLANLAALALVLVVTAVYMLFWTGIALLVLARQPGAGAALGTLAAIWAGVTIGVPLAVSALVAAADPPPSAIDHVDAQRRVGDEVEAGRVAILTAALQERPDLRPHVDRIATLDYATRLSFLVPETERRLASLRAAADAHRQRQLRIAMIAGYLVPSLGVESALADIAGTDPGRQWRFESQAREYQQQLRGIVYPLVHREIAQPPPETRTTRGRLTLREPLALPAFELVDPSERATQAAIWPFAGWLALLAALLISGGLSRARRWQVVDG